MLFLFLTLLDEDETERFTLLYNKYKNLMYNVAVDYTNDEQYAEDAVQEAFEYIAKNFHIIKDVESTSTKNLTALITKCFAIKCFSKQINTVPLEDFIDDPMLESNTEDEFIRKSNIDSLHAAIDKLGDMYRIPIFLKHIYGYRSKEIAALMGLSDDAVRRRIFVAKKKVKAILESEMKIDG